jgi:LPXTG-motif cell wall-anchored protein
MEIKLPSTGSHRLDWFLMLSLAIVLMVIFV